MRGRSYSYSPSPPRGGYSRRHRSPSPRGRRYGARDHDLPTSLLVRNLRHDCRTEDLRGPFGEFGPLKDVYLPRDYYTGEPRGFGFVQFLDPDDAAEAKYHMDGQTLLGREMTVVFAEENRKKPAEMRARDRVRSTSRSLSQYSSRRARSFSRSPDHYRTSSRIRRYSRSISPGDRSYRERSYSRSPYYSRYRERSYSRSPSPRYAHRRRSYSRSPYDTGSKYRERSYSRSPYRRSPIPARGRSRSPEDC